MGERDLVVSDMGDWGFGSKLLRVFSLFLLVRA
jgi:hypothetical protein